MSPKSLLALPILFAAVLLSLDAATQEEEVSATKFSAAALPSPQLKGPPNGTRLQSMGPTTLYWLNPPGTTQYHIKVTPYNDDGPGINLIIGDPAKVASESFIVEPPNLGVGMYVLLPDMSYTWRVRVTDAAPSVG